MSRRRKPVALPTSWTVDHVDDGDTVLFSIDEISEALSEAEERWMDSRFFNPDHPFLECPESEEFLEMVGRAKAIIAAAPDLYAAAIKAVTSIRINDAYEDNIPVPRAVLLQLQAAIGKAERGQS